MEEISAKRKIEAVSLTLGIVGLCFAFFLPIGAYPIAVVGLVFATGRRHSHKATAGFVLCIVGLALALLANVFGATLAVWQYF